MRIGLFSDVHGNLAALNAVLEALNQHSPLDARVCAGDMVYLGPSPAEVLDRLQKEGVQLTRGNADDMVTGLLPPEAPPNPCVAAILAEHVTWNRDRLRPDQLELLRTLPLTLRFGTLLVCHSSPESHNDTYPRLHEHSLTELRRVYGVPGVQAVACGHWHNPGVAPLGDVTLVNVSCVSIPVDGKPMAGYTIAEYHDGFWSFQQHRVTYDLAPEIARMQERSMPKPPWPRYSHT